MNTKLNTTFDSSLDLSVFDTAERKLLLRPPSELRASLSRRFMISNMALFVFTAVAVVLLWYFGRIVWMQHRALFWSVIIFAVITVCGFWMLVLLSLSGAIPLEQAFRCKEYRKLLGRYSTEEITATANAVGERLGGVEVPNLYIRIDKTANASTINSKFLNFIKRYNAIYLNSYLFAALDHEELKAIFVHELAHFHCFINPLGRNRWIMPLLNTGSVFAIFVLLPFVTEAWYWIVLTFALAPWPFAIAVRLFQNSTKRDQEYASDAASAELVGALPAVNALLKTGDRHEIYEFIQDEIGRLIEKYPSANIGEVVKELPDRFPEKPIDIDEAKKLISGLLKDRFYGGTEKTNKSYLKRITNNIKRRKTLKAVRWNDFDNVHRDDKLDAVELDKYVRALLFCDRTSTHKIASFHPDMEKRQGHPSTRKRIVYIYLHYITLDESGRIRALPCDRQKTQAS